MSDGRTWGTVIGGVVGFFTGGIGWAAGAAIGGVVGGFLEPKKHTETNRIDDIKVSLSKYGDGIPETWGNNIPSATCVWSTYIIELPENQSSGKGGGVENTNYRQFIQSMWCLGKTPPPGSTVTIRKVWIDGKLNYDSSSGLSIGQALATKENPFTDLAILPGFDDQLPVAMIETYEGVGNVPAFRGRICIFIFGLECPGGRIPQLQFELCIDADAEPTITDGEDFVIPAQNVGSQPLHSHVGDLPIMLFTQDSVAVPGGNGKSVGVYALGENYLTKVKSFTLSSSPVASGLPGYGDIDLLVQAWPTVTGSDQGQIAAINTDGDVKLLEVGDGFSAYLENATWAKWGNRIAVTEDSNGTDRIALFDYETGVLLATITEPGLRGLWMSDAAVFLHRFDSVSSKWYIDVLNRDDLTLVASQELPAALSLAFFVSPYEDGLYVIPPGTMDIWSIDGYGYATFIDSGIGTPSGNIRSPILYEAGKVLGWNGVAAAAHIFLADLQVFNPQPADVATFIENQSLRSGLTADQIDLSTIDDSFWGVTLKSPASARANITPLMTYGAIGVVEEDGLLRFFNRADKASVVTIPYEELGYAEDGAEPGDPFALMHLNAQELPRSLTVTYNDYNFDYQVSTVKAMRYAVDSVLDESVTLDIATNGERAATIAYRLMFEKWLAQNTRSLAVSRKHAYLSAGDVITVLSNDGSYGDWMISKITDTGARMEIECFPSDSELLIQVVPGPGGYWAQQIEPLATPTLAIPIDTSILRDVDNNAGIYFAMAGYGPSYPGGELFTGPDDGGLTSRGIVTAEAPMGVAEGVLGDWTINVADETNLLTVNMGHHVLSSITRDVLLAGSENVAAIGAQGRWEIIKFQRATDLGGGLFLLSGLLRGLRGTEFATGLHQSGDRFALMSTTGILRPNMDAGEINQTEVYRAITTGRSFNSVASQSFVNTAEGLKPFSPVDSRVTPSGSDSVITWRRRTRLAENALAGVLPLGETSEAYIVEIYSDDTFSVLIRTLAATSETVTYTAAMKTEDGYTSGPIYRRIYQISSTVGKGHVLEVTE